MTDRIALITGGASGIGRETCIRLAEDGYRLAVFDLDGAQAAVMAGNRGLGRTVDVSDVSNVEAAVAEILDAFGHIDLVVNNAGITGSAEATTCHETPIEEWDRVFGVNVRGPFIVTRAILPSMVERGSGHVITVASVAGMVAFPGRCAYTASKGAALQFARSVAVDYAPLGIRSNAVCPGFVATPMTQWRLDDPELRRQVEANIPLGRVADSGSIADAIASLASDRMSYVNGAALVVDGGWTAK